MKDHAHLSAVASTMLRIAHSRQAGQCGLSSHFVPWREWGINMTVEEFAKQYVNYPDQLNIRQMREMCGGICNKTSYNLRRKLDIPTGSVGRTVPVPKDAIIQHLYNQHCVENCNGPYIQVMRNFYADLYRDYPDVMTSFEIQQLVGYVRSAILRWLKDGKIKSFKCAEHYKIPKAYLIDFVVSPYYQQIGLKSKKHRLDMERFEVYYKTEVESNEW